MMQSVQNTKLWAQLVSMGLPLGGSFEPVELPDDLALVIAEALKLARQNSTVARCWPLLVSGRRAFFLDKKNLERVSLLSCEKKALGFFLDLTAELSKERSFREVSEEWMHSNQLDVSSDESFFLYQKMTPSFRCVAERNTPAVARRWKFVMNEGLDSFEKIFRSFVGLEARG